MCQNCAEHLKRLQDNLRNQNSGADIHEVGAQRQIIANLIYLIERGHPDDLYICQQTEIIGRRQIEFFKKKYFGHRRVS